MVHMPGTLVIGCGGPGRRAVARLDDPDFTYLTIDWNDSDIVLLRPGETEDSVKGDRDLVRARFLDHMEELSSIVSEFPQVVLATSPASPIGRTSVEVVSQCARSSEKRFIAVLIVPFVFEEKRREETLSILPGMVSLSDRAFVLDMQESGEMTDIISDAIGAIDGFCGSAIHRIAGIVGSIPFMSTFTAPMYFFRRGEGRSVSESFANAMARKIEAPWSADGGMVVVTDAPLDHEAAKQAVQEIARGYGRIPEIVQGSGDGTGVTVFISISLRT